MPDDVHRFRAAHVVTPDGVLDDAVVEVRGERVAAVHANAWDERAERLGGWVVPGFVDTHVHGGGGHDYASADPDEVLAARDFHARHGTTTTFASLVTASVDDLCAQLDVLADLVEDGHLAGAHLEGPFLSAQQPGAHEPSLLRAPDPESVDRLVEAGRGCLRLVTLAPELRGGLDAVRRFVAAGVHVAVGHTAADDAMLVRALEAGADVGTHVFNAMSPIHHRKSGPVPRLLTDPHVAAELIADGFHVAPEVLTMALGAAGPEGVVLVTDAMVAAGMPDGPYTLGSLDVQVTDGQARLVGADGEPGAIAGSTLTTGRAFGLVASLTHDLAAAARVASTNAARHYGLDAGTVSAGGPADLCLVDDAGALQRVMLRGRWLETA
ncbi:N-acetylglucosamine 6-phosphate deacetylase [Microlunatus sagamiharensis]|uniref:N-acetylglucosamine 6-phosphate deacetylase n=1 Tax=Microlunatus sagamiharensis TaxID=546874 RepID=A0A1H2N994_9ACTN|nr:N-acetylglucosamine-6-phosphate deacetylase [Microlunatus sagamiharensis]SDV01838.1 N-acetylglucosamine 6-phosphate deacetylase [Microlunatus sagamiharensis]